ncbi:LysR family transcriptional regulator [Shewanella litorisediminis]|uniref:LysR family transcriptional regulator n=1 Tax=Shewanella litorisediminis TaxID=1173586 RepID=A0ABX7G0P7_9GAMM|nr:LysR family transcriptional regulator [Shewanella litorisediminis]MCL2919855.1 LysR family transcriptional regulator [Shewanella litorisediminis]QRH00895.1 LysR family transcriptional regulator [Shewanella litorisediminis]
MELRHLKHFVVLAETKSFHRAAGKLNITQPSLSKSIKKFEALVGGAVFTRTAKEVVITDFGTMVLSHSQRILNECEKLEHDLGAFKGIDSKEMAIGASPIPSHSLVGPILGDFLAHYPDLTIDLQVAGWDRLYEQLLNREIDFFIAESRLTDLDKSQMVDLIDLPEFPVIFCCRAGHPLTGLNRLFLTTLRDYPLAIPRRLPTRVAEEFEDLFKKHRDDFSGLVRFGQFHSIREAVLTTDLVAMTPDIAVRSELEQGSLVRLTPTLMPELYARFSIVFLKEKPQNHIFQNFVDFLKQRVAQLTVGEIS